MGIQELHYIFSWMFLARRAGATACLTAIQPVRTPFGAIFGCRVEERPQSTSDRLTGNGYGEGSRMLSTSALHEEAGGFMQLIKFTTCNTSNIARIEEHDAPPRLSRAFDQARLSSVPGRTAPARI